jgi:methylenetetrahydrofolate--tRNA-(uracil-5-)-methyltransferase
MAAGEAPIAPPRPSAFGSLMHYVTQADPKNFQPANITFDLLPALEQKIRDRKERHQRQCEIALQEFDVWRSTVKAASEPKAIDLRTFAQ